MENIGKIIAVIAFAMPLLSDFAQAKPPESNVPRKKAYALLNVKPGATRQEIEASYKERIKKIRLSEDDDDDDEQEALITTAFVLLSNPKLKKKYDEGERGEVEIAPEDREELARLLEPFNRKESSKLRETGIVALDLGSDMATFYVAEMVATLAKCFKTENPLYCEHFFESLKEPSSYVGFMLFVAVNRRTSAALSKALGTGFIARHLTGSAALGLAAFTNDAFTELIGLPEMDELLRTFEIMDPVEREKKMTEARQKLLAKTFLNKEWYTEKVPALTSMILAGLASQIPASTFKWTLKSGSSKLKSLRASRTGRPSRALNCLIAALDRAISIINAEGWNGVPQFLHNKTSAFFGLLSFMALNSLFHDPVDRAWQAITLDRELASTRKALPKAAKYYELNQSDENAKEFLTLLNKNISLWDAHRRKELSDVESTMAIHTKALQEFEKSIGKPSAFYAWFVNGFKEDEANWGAIAETFYSPWTKPEDVKDEIAKYLNGFFCGPEPSDTFRESKHLHGIPVPGKMNIKIDSFRVFPEKRQDLCGKGPDELKAAIRKDNFGSFAREAEINFRMAARPFRFKRIETYDNAVDADIVKSLESEILPTIDTQLDELGKIKSQLNKTAIARDVAKKVDTLRLERETIKSLLRYFKTPPSERKIPEAFLEDSAFDMLNALDPSQDKDHVNAIKHYERFILK